MKNTFRIALTLLLLPVIGAGFVARILLQAAYVGYTAGEAILGELFSG